MGKTETGEQEAVVLTGLILDVLFLREQRTLMPNLCCAALDLPAMMQSAPREMQHLFQTCS